MIGIKLIDAQGVLYSIVSLDEPNHGVIPPIIKLDNRLFLIKIRQYDSDYAEYWETLPVDLGNSTDAKPTREDRALYEIDKALRNAQKREPEVWSLPSVDKRGDATQTNRILEQHLDGQLAYKSQALYPKVIVNGKEYNYSYTNDEGDFVYKFGDLEEVVKAKMGSTLVINRE